MMTPRHLVPAAAFLGLVCGWAPARAQEDMPWFRLTGWDVYSELATRFESENRYRLGSDYSWSSASLELYETAGVDVEGFSYHPKFLRIFAGTELTLVQGFGEASSRILPQARWALQFLESHPYNLAVYGSVARSTVDRAFAPSYTVLSQHYGLAARYRPRRQLLFGLNLDHRSFDRDLPGETDARDDELTAFMDYEVGDNTKGEARYHLIFSELQGRSLRRQGLSWQHGTAFGNDNNKRFLGRARVEQQASQATSYGSTGGVGLDWRHSKTLSSHYRGDLAALRSDNGWSTSWTASTSLLHRLYESLQSRPELLTRLESAPHGSSSSARVSTMEAYSKRLGGWGRLNISVAPFVEALSSRPIAAQGRMDNEAHRLRAEIPVTLAMADIDETSVSVSDESGLRSYVRNVDYVLAVRGSLIQIARLPTGEIGDGEFVFVDYTYRLKGDSAVISTSVMARTALAIGPRYSIYGEVLTRSQEQVGGELEAVLRDELIQTMGAQAVLPYVGARAEVSRADNTATRYWSHRESIAFVIDRWKRLRGTLMGERNAMRYSIPAGEEVNRVLFASTLGGRLTSTWSVSARGDLVRERWVGEMLGGNNDLDAIGASVIFRGRYGMTDLEFEARVNRVQRSDHVENTDLLYARVRRDF